MIVILLLLVQRVPFALIAVAVVLVLFTTTPLNLRGAGLMACLAIAAYATARAVVRIFNGCLSPRALCARGSRGGGRMTAIEVACL